MWTGSRWDTPNLMMHDNLGNYLLRCGHLINVINDMIHTNYTGKISISEDVYNYIGFNSAWDTGPALLCHAGADTNVRCQPEHEYDRVCSYQ